jgi:hypothetical protein
MSIEPGTFTLAVRCPNHYAIDDQVFQCVKLIQYKTENLSLKTLHMEEVGKFFIKKMSEMYNLSLNPHNMGMPQILLLNLASFYKSFSMISTLYSCIIQNFISNSSPTIPSCRKFQPLTCLCLP